MTKILMIMAGLMFSSNAFAADICTGTVLQNIPQSGDSYSARRGEKIEAVTQYVKRGRQYLFCSHGGGCYSAFVPIKGRPVRAISLDNCTIDMRHPETSYGETIYPIEVDRRRNTAAKLRYEDIDNRLLELGMCSACASNAAYVYIHQPASSCAQVVKMALEGNPVARRRLEDDDGTLCKAKFK